MPRAATKPTPASDRDDSEGASLLSDDEKSYLMEMRRPRNFDAFLISYMNSSACEVRYLEMMEHFVELGLAREQLEMCFRWRLRDSAVQISCGETESCRRSSKTVEASRPRII